MSKIDFKIKDKENCCFSVELKKVYPETNDLEITPSKSIQVHTPDNCYGYDKVTVNPIPGDYIIPSGNINILSNGSYDVNDVNRVDVNVPIPDGYVLPEGTLNITENGVKEVNNYENVDVNVPIPSDYIKPSGTIEITESGEYDVTEYANANVTVSGGGGGKYAPRAIDFSGYKGTELTYELENLDTTNLTSMMDMFYTCSNLISLDLSSFNTSNVTKMSGMFNGCSKLTEVNLSTFNTQNVTVMNNMFNQCCELISLDLSSFNTSNVTNMKSLVAYCTKLTQLDIRNFDFTKVTNYSTMFGTSSTTGVPDSCLIIVKDDAAKEWITSKFTRLTNVKTVAEL